MAVKNPTVFLKPMVFGVPNFGQTHFLTLNGCSLGKNIGMRNRTFKSMQQNWETQTQDCFLGFSRIHLFISNWCWANNIRGLFTIVWPKRTPFPRTIVVIPAVFMHSIGSGVMDSSWFIYMWEIVLLRVAKKIRQCRNGKDKQGYNKPVAADTFLNLRMDFRSP